MVGSSRIAYSQINGIKLSKLMLGTVQLGIHGYGIHNQGGPVEAEAVLEQCVRSGVNSYDTAFEYGNAEIILGSFFMDKEPPFIVSKLKVDLGPLSGLELERQMTQRTEEILDRLRIRSLPALMLHDPRMLQVHGKNITMVMQKLRRDGLIVRGGFSFGACPDEDYAVCSEELKDDVYEIVQLPLNLFDRRAIDCGALRELNGRGKMVVARSVFLQGLFFHDEMTLPKKLREAEKGELALLRTIAAEAGISVAQLAISFVRDLPEVHSLVIGAETPEQVAANIALMNGPVLEEAYSEKLKKAFGSVQKQLITPSLWQV